MALYHFSIKQVSRGKGTKAVDTKAHSFAREGWNYRTAYFEDFDGKYYSFQISVGKDRKVNTIYNVNKIKGSGAPEWLKGTHPQNATVGTQTSNTSISEDSENVNGKFSLSSEVGVEASNIGYTKPKERSQGKGGDLRSKYDLTLTVVRKQYNGRGLFGKACRTALDTLSCCAPVPAGFTT